MLSRYDDCAATMRDPRLGKDYPTQMVARFGEDWRKHSSLVRFEHSLLNLDGPAHSRLRKLVVKGFTRRSAGAELQVRGTADRILELSSGEVRVSDYKTRRDTRDLLRPSWIRKGLALQIPLYLLAVGEEHPDGNVVGEALAVPLRPERDRDGRRKKRTALSLEDAAEQALPAIDVLTRLLQAGAFPFRRDAHCSHCAYVVACRKAHPPSEERVRSAAPFREYFELHGDPD